MHQQKNKRTVRVIVIGGGLSGLTAAERILIKSKNESNQTNVTVTVLEAMNRVGGRTETKEIEGTKFDFGGQWIGNTQKHVQQLAERSKNQLFPQFHSGIKILHFGNKVSTYKTDIPLNVGIIPLIQMQTLIWKIDRMAKKVDLLNPRECSQSIYWDSLTVHTWLRLNCYSTNIKKLFQCAVRAIFGAQTDQISFLFFLWYTHQSQGVQNLININNGLQQKKMIHGSQYLSQFLKKQISKLSGKVQTQIFVQKISKKINDQESNEYYQIEDKSGRLFQADIIIIATPPSCIKKIQFTPKLSRQRRMICERSFMGSISKIVILYKQAYWRQNGFSGETLSDCIETPVFNAYDDCRTKENGEVQPAMLVFINAQVDRQWSKDKQTSQKIIIQTLSKYFKDQRLLSPLSIHWKTWNEELSLNGGPVSMFPPGVLTKITDIRKPEGNIHWAGTQMATVSQGFMDGAIESGIRCSDEVLRKIGIQSEVQKQKSSEVNKKWYYNISNAKKKLLEWW